MSAASASCPISSDNSTAIQRAALWLATGNADRRRPLVPQLRAEFGLTTMEACEAIRESRLVLARAH